MNIKICLKILNKNNWNSLVAIKRGRVRFSFDENNTKYLIKNISKCFKQITKGEVEIFLVCYSDTNKVPIPVNFALKKRKIDIILEEPLKIIPGNINTLIYHSMVDISTLNKLHKAVIEYDLAIGEPVDIMVYVNTLCGLFHVYDDRGMDFIYKDKKSLEIALSVFGGYNYTIY